MNRSLLLLAALAFTACPGPEDTDDTDGTDGTDANPQCDAIPNPIPFTTVTGFSGSEDFAFDAEGGLVSVDENGNLTSRKRDGTERIIAPGFSETAGTHFQPNGDLILANAEEGTLIRVTPNGGTEVIHSGMTYPNGVTVDAEGNIFTADQETGIVWRLDGQTGVASQVATGLFAPNGVTVGANDTLFVGSFGGGNVVAIDKSGDGYGEPRQIGSVLEQDGAGGEVCGEADAGAYCMTPQYQLGTCEGSAQSLSCDPIVDTDACDGKTAGDACTTTVFGTAIDSTCQGDTLFCPFTPQDKIDACDGLEAEDDCSVGNDDGYCFPTAQAINACVSFADDFGESACQGLADGDPCQSSNSHYPVVGECFGFDGVSYCEGSGGEFGEEGGLDGIIVDECDNVYVTEFVAGVIWRMDSAGVEEPEVVVELPSSWIPNLHWGNGVGGWERDTLYVMDRDEGRVFELEIGVGAKIPTFVPGGTNE